MQGACYSPAPVAGRRVAAEVSDVTVTGRDGVKSVVKVSVPAPECPAADAPVEKFEEAAKKAIVHAVMDPGSIAALKEGLSAPRLEERRKWWQLLLSHAAPLLDQVSGGAGPGGVRISFTQNVPAPSHEDGPIGDRRPTIDVTEDDAAPTR